FSGVVAVLLALYFLRFARNKTEQTSLSTPWAVQALWVGLLAVILGVLPGWMTYRPALDPPFGNRIVMPALLGLGILIVAFIEWLSQNQRRNMILLGALCGVSVYSHLYNANTYREVWNTQRNFYWQLFWRVPALEPGTALISDGEVVLGAGDYATDSAINLIYAREFNLEEFPYWFFNMEQRFNSQMERFLAGRNIRESFRTWQFIGDANNILLIDNSVEGCMKVLAGNQPENSELSPLLTQALPLVNLDRIISQPQEISLPPAEIFGPEPAHTWCYYYQKADMARQAGDWQEVIALGEQADQAGYQPVKRSEWLLFVDAYVHIGDFTSAEELTLRIQASDPRLIPLLCTYWSGQTTLPAGFLESLSQKLECG
ncbi:MAG TPA: hypothetical protein VJM08_18475, partial [Anaerolineales bacterium]|nr:hypothetical protein [Anaerolineales bacterium]